MIFQSRVEYLFSVLLFCHHNNWDGRAKVNRVDQDHVVTFDLGLHCLSQIQ